LHAELARYKELHSRSGSGPNAYLLEQLTAAETKTERVSAGAAELRAELRSKQEALEEAQRKLQLMHRDLQVVLEQRNVLDSLKAGLSTVMTLHGQAPLQPSQAPNVQRTNFGSKR
jgi:chromosome segregation ATPase